MATSSDCFRTDECGPLATGACEVATPSICFTHDITLRMAGAGRRVRGCCRCDGDVLIRELSPDSTRPSRWLNTLTGGEAHENHDL